MNFKTYIIAEIGGNHNGDLSLAKKLILLAKKSGANAVKFQTFNPQELTLSNNKLADYQIKNFKKKISPIEILKLCSLSHKNHKKLYNYSKKIHIDFISSAFDEESLDFLSKDLKLKTHKLPSGEITNINLIYKHGSYKNNLIISTGMSNIKEISDSLAFYICGYNKKKIKYKTLNSKKIIKKNFDILKKKITLLHCVSNYPTKLNEINLKNIQYLKSIFKLNVGLSDHTTSENVPAFAVTLGSTVIEKHFTLNQKMYGPDHKISLEPKQFKNMTRLINEAELTLGKKKREISKSEKKLSNIVRKILVAKKNIKKNNLFTEENLTTKRGSDGLSAKFYFDLLNKKSNKNYKINDKIQKSL